MIHKKLLIIIFLISSFSGFSQSKNFPKNMYSEGGCSKSYFEKARKMNKTMGFSIGGAAIIGSTILPGSALLVLGGVGTAGETSYSYLEEKEIKDKRKQAPRVRYPLARQYFDIANALELNKIININKEEQEISEYIPMYIDSLFPSKATKSAYKECKSLAKLQGLSKSEIKEVEKSIMSYVLEEKHDSHTPLAKVKEDMANCFLNIADGSTYPVADKLLLASELKKEKLLSWRFKSVVRLVKYAKRKARKSGKTLSAKQFFNSLSQLDETQEACEVSSKPLNRKHLVKKILELI